MRGLVSKILMSKKEYNNEGIKMWKGVERCSVPIGLML